MTTRKTEKLILSWIEFQRTNDSNLHWTVMAFDDLTNNDPEEAWNTIKSIFEIAKHEREIIGVLAAGPLEDLLIQNGATILETMSDYLKVNPGFKKCLEGVWLDKEDPIFEKIEALMK